jgi:hypothetical protein
MTGIKLIRLTRYASYASNRSLTLLKRSKRVKSEEENDKKRSLRTDVACMTRKVSNGADVKRLAIQTLSFFQESSIVCVRVPRLYSLNQLSIDLSSSLFSLSGS